MSLKQLSHNLYKLPNKMNVPLVEEEDMYHSSHQPQCWCFCVTGEYSRFSVLVEVLLTEAVMKQRKPFNLFIKRALQASASR